MVIKALPIAEALYPGYLLLCLFNNITSYSIANNAFYTIEMNKKSGRKQVWLCKAWHEKDKTCIEQSMSY